jgi:hypothetical protein
MTETVKMLLALGLPFLFTLVLLYFTLKSSDRHSATTRDGDRTGRAVSAALMAERADAARKNKRENF